eukprot:6246380-Pyramimonas_sp.AAC.1
MAVTVKTVNGGLQHLKFDAKITRLLTPHATSAYFSWKLCKFRSLSVVRNPLGSNNVTLSKQSLVV